MCWTAISLGSTPIPSRCTERRGSISSGARRACSRSCSGGGWPLRCAQGLLVGTTFFLVYLAARATGAAADGRPAHDRRLRGGLARARDATAARCPAPVRSALVGHRGAARHPARLWAAPVLAALVREHPWELHDVPPDPRACVARGSARAIRSRARTLLIPGHHGRDVGEPLRPTCLDVRLRPRHQPRHPRHDQRMGATDPRDGARLVHDRVRARGGAVPIRRRNTDPVDIVLCARVLLPAGPVRAASDRVVGHGGARRPAPCCRPRPRTSRWNAGDASPRGACLRDRRHPARRDRGPRALVARHAYDHFLGAAPPGLTAAARTSSGRHPNAGSPTVGIVVRIRAPGPSGLRGFSDRDRPEGHLARLRAGRILRRRMERRARPLGRAGDRRGRDWDLFPVLEETDSGWRVAYEDDDGYLFVRN